MANRLNLQFEAGPHTEEIERTLFDTLKRYFSAEDDIISPDQAAKSIDELCPPTVADDDEINHLAVFLFKFWMVAFQIVEQINYDDIAMQRFILLTKALRDIPSEKTLRPQYGSDYRQKVWQDLPSMTSEFQDRWRRKFNFSFLSISNRRP
jgi:hypothetical protein